jgi:hypothetical protein
LSFFTFLLPPPMLFPLPPSPTPGSFCCFFGALPGPSHLRQSPLLPPLSPTQSLSAHLQSDSLRPQYVLFISIFRTHTQRDEVAFIVWFLLCVQSCRLARCRGTGEVKLSTSAFLLLKQGSDSSCIMGTLRGLNGAMLTQCLKYTAHAGGWCL